MSGVIPLSTSPLVQSPYPPSNEPPVSPLLAEKRATSRGSILFAVAVFLLLLVCYKILKELEIIYVAALFAVVLMPVVTKITTWRIGRYKPSVAVALAFLIVTVLAALTLFFTIGLPPVLKDVHRFSSDLPKEVPAFVARIKHLPGADKLGVDELAAKAENFAGAVGAYIVTALPAWLSHVLDIVTTIFLSIYFMLEGDEAYSFFLSLTPVNNRRRLDVALKKAALKMSKWLFGQGMLMLLLGVLSTITFGFLHVRYFILLGVCMGLLNIIPIAGGVVTIAVVAIVAAFDSWSKMAGVLIFYAVYVNLENAVFTPRIMKSSVDLSGLTVLVALLFGTALAGITGALVAVPTAALVAVLLEEYAVQH